MKRTEGADPLLAVPPASAEIELKVDGFLLRWIEDANYVDFAPLEIRPWVAARLLTALTMASEVAETNDELPDAPPEPVLEKLLIHDWHSHLKNRWETMVKQVLR